MKLFQILYLIINVYNILSLKNSIKLEDSDNIKYLEYSFKRNLTINELLKPESFFKNYFYNQIYINIKIGSNKLEIPFYFYLQQFPLVIESSNVIQSQVKGIYNELESKTYNSIKEENLFTLGDLYKANLTVDYFYFNNNIDSPINFYLAKENYENSHITEGGKIGFKPFPPYGEDDKTSFINNLKNNQIISSKIVSIKYDSNKIEEDSGKLYIGQYPHNINSVKYNEDDYISDKAEMHYIISHFDWIYNFDEIRIDDEIIDTKRDTYFYSEIGFIIGNRYFFNYLESLDSWNEYFHKTEKCHEYKFKINDFESNDYYQRFLTEFTGYYCDKEVDIEKLNLGNIIFVKKPINYTFNFNIKEKKKKKNEYKYFLIIHGILENLFLKNIKWFSTMIINKLDYIQKYQMMKIIIIIIIKGKMKINQILYIYY